VNDPEDIRNWLRLSDRITTSGRLLPGDPRRLAALGVKRVINLALPSVSLDGNPRRGIVSVERVRFAS